MTFRKLLLGTTALLGAGVLGVAAPRTAGAAEVTPGGALDISLSGFAYFRAHWGDLDNARLDDSFATGVDFSNDTEVHVIIRGQDDATGTEYGGTVEFEADTNREDNTDESWIFVSGGFGEIRLGDEDGVVDNSAVGAANIAAGTGGIDGSIVDVIGTGIVKPANVDDVTKIRYYSPSFGGLTLAASYTPNASDDRFQNSGDDVAQTNVNEDGEIVDGVDIKNVVEGGLIYEGDFAGFGVTASVVGEYGDIASDANIDGDDFWGWMAGAAVDVFGFKVAGGYFQQKVGDDRKDVVNAGVGAELGPASVSLTGGYVIDIDSDELDHPYNIVLSADVGLMPGLVLAGDVGYFDNDTEDDVFEGGDDGYQAVVRLGLAF